MLLLLHLHHWPLALAIVSCLVAAPTTTAAATATATTTSTTSSASTTTSSIPGKYQAYGSQHQPKKLRIGFGAAAAGGAGAGAGAAAGGVGGGSNSSALLNANANKPVFRQNPIKNWFGVFNRNNSPPAQDQTATCSCRLVPSSTPFSTLQTSASKSCHGHDRRLPVSQVIQLQQQQFRLLSLSRHTNRSYSYKMQDTDTNTLTDTDFGVSTQHSQRWHMRNHWDLCSYFLKVPHYSSNWGLSSEPRRFLSHLLCQVESFRKENVPSFYGLPGELPIDFAHHT